VSNIDIHDLLLPILLGDEFGEEGRQSVGLGAVVAAHGGQALKQRPVVNTKPAL
jgi:hypothetical protein